MFPVLNERGQMVGSKSFPMVRDFDSAVRMGGGGAVLVMDAAIAGGLAFLNGELEKRDPKVREPLAAIWWPRDITAKTGGGWVDWTSTLNVSYATAGGNQNGIIGGESNAIPVMQADIGKDVYPVFTWCNLLSISYVDQAKLQNIGRSLDDILDKGIRLNYQKTVDQNVYTGFSSAGQTGLVNNPNVAAASAPVGASGYTQWSKKTPQEILNDVNTALTDAWTASGYDVTGMPDTVLIPPAQYQYLVTTVVSTAGNQSILKFLLENNVALEMGVELHIGPRPFLKAAGTGGTDRMMVYRNDEDRVYFDMPVPLSRILTQPDVKEMAYLSAYAAQIGVVKFLYLEPVQYMDGI